MTPGVVLAEYESLGEARADREALEAAGVDAWLEGQAGIGLVRLVVRPDAEDEARALLEELQEGWVVPTSRRRPVWIPVVAALVAIGLIWAAVPQFLWPWILLAGFVGFLLWRAVAPRRP